MAQFQDGDLDYVVDDLYDMTGFEDEYDNPFAQNEPETNNGSDPLDSDFEDDFESSKSKTDTSALEARNGKDIQGIPWERLNFSRDEYRETRLKQYRNYENLSRSREDLDKECLQIEKGKTFYDFQFNTRLVKSTIVHFQHVRQPLIGRYMMKDAYFILALDNCSPNLNKIKRYNMLKLKQSLNKTKIATSPFISAFKAGWRAAGVALLIWYDRIISEHLEASVAIPLRNLLWATSKHDVYLMQNYSVMHWSSLLRRGKEVLNVAKPIVPTLTHPGLLSQSLSRVQISTMAVKENFLVAGGFQGELICKNLNQPGVAFCTKITTDENAITNAVDVYHNPNGSMRVMTANNDAQVRVFDAENFACLNRFSFNWSVNNTSVSPDGKLVSVLGDSAECLIADAQSGKVVGNLKGHLDYSFASAWHPDGQILATGNQDTTCRLWDIRNLSESVAVIKGRMGAIRAVKFSSDGRFMAMAEPADFVHIFDTKSGYVHGQEIDMFGEIAGISFSPDAEALFVGVSDRTYGSLLEFNRRHYNRYEDSIY
ncbi:putative wd repeat-containing protein c2a9.03 [Quercus suber]|uniref:Wd repeat-containing protein c2a9.03 n=1 Tax=Quercus suber TaxID=58331 RepID=A0AAW0KZW8_QUESU